jgi:hypothetical protein
MTAAYSLVCRSDHNRWRHVVAVRNLQAADRSRSKQLWLQCCDISLLLHFAIILLHDLLINAICFFVTEALKSPSLTLMPVRS